VCSDVLAKKISDDIGLLLPPKPAAEARALFKPVVMNCPTNKVQAATAAVEYYRYFLTKLYAGVVFQVAQRPVKLATHFNDVARFVAQDEQFLASMFADGTEGAYGSDGGFLRVCDVGTSATPLCTIATKNKIAGIAVPPTALRDVYPAYVFAIGLIPDSPRCGRQLVLSPASTELYAENLKFKPPCYDAVVFPQYENPDLYATPASLAATTFQYPWVTVAVCPVEESITESSRFRLAIPDPQSVAGVPDVVKLGPRASEVENPDDPDNPGLPAALQTALNTFLGPATGGLSSNCDAAASYSSLLRPTNTVVAWLDRLASRAAGLVGPKSLYAAHATVSGTVKALPKSPVGPVDPRTFFGTLTAFAAGTRLDLLGAPQIAEAGRWTTLFATSPGSITVQSSIGDATLGFVNSKPAVLSQGGGACGTVGNASCGMLTMEGTVTGPPAVTGIYRVSWKSLQNQPAPKFAALDVRDSDGNVLARVSYSNESGQRVLRYNATGPGTGTPVGTWKVGVVQSFVLTIDLNSLNTPDAISLTITTPTGTTSTCPCSSLDYFNYPNVATNLKHITADFSGIDSGILAWDDIEILRLPDQPADY